MHSNQNQINIDRLLKIHLIPRMKKNYNLELGLSQPSRPPPSNPHQQQLTIFYDGQISVCDVTELQARAVITEASKEMDQQRCKWRSFDGSSESGSSRGLISPTSPLQPQLCSPSSSTSGMSMKKSLERFLQKRKDRQLSKR